MYVPIEAEISREKISCFYFQVRFFVTLIYLIIMDSNKLLNNFFEIILKNDQIEYNS